MKIAVLPGDGIGTEIVEQAVRVLNAADFGGVLPSGVVNFASGETSATITVNVTADALAEADEGITVTLSAVPPDALARWPLVLSQGGTALTYTFDTQQEDTGIAALLRALAEHGIDFKDLHSSESSLEDIFVSLVHQDTPQQKAPQA